MDTAPQSNGGWQEYRRQVLGDLQRLNEMLQVITGRQDQMRGEMQQTFERNRAMRDDTWQNEWQWKGSVDSTLKALTSTLMTQGESIKTLASQVGELEREKEQSTGIRSVGKTLLPFVYALFGFTLAYFFHH